MTKICSTQSSTISWTTPVNITKAGFAHPYEILVPDQCYRIRGFETVGTNSIHPCMRSLLWFRYINHLW